MPALFELSAAAHAVETSERRGRATNKKTITPLAGASASSSRPTAHSRSKGPDRRLTEMVPFQYSSDSESDSESDEASTSSGHTDDVRSKRSLRSRYRQSSVAQDLDTFAFDSDEEGEQSRYLDQQDQWLRSKGKDARDVRFVLDNSKRDGMIATQLLKEMNGIGLDARAVVPYQGDATLSPSTTRYDGKAASRSPSPHIERKPASLQFARKPSLTSGSQGIPRSSHSTSPVRPAPRMGRQQSAAATTEPPQQTPKATQFASQTSSPPSLSRRRSDRGAQPSQRRPVSKRNASIASLDALPWLRNLQNEAHDDSDATITVSDDDDQQSESSYVSLARGPSSTKKDRRLSGTLTSVCKAHATGVCERNPCDRHGTQAQILSLATGCLRQSLGQGRARSQSAIHLSLSDSGHQS